MGEGGRDLAADGADRGLRHGGQPRDELVKLVVGSCAFDLLAAREERRRGVHARLLSLLSLRLHLGQVPIGVQAGFEGGLVDADLSGELRQVLLAERPRVLPPLLREELVVVEPEQSLVLGALRRLGCPDRLLPQEGEIVPDQPGGASRYVLALELAPWTQGELLTGRSLEIAPLVDGHRGAGIPECVARRGQGRGWAAGGLLGGLLAQEQHADADRGEQDDHAHHERQPGRAALALASARRSRFAHARSRYQSPVLLLQTSAGVEWRSSQSSTVTSTSPVF